MTIHYPKKDSLSIGVLLIDPLYRKNGLGSFIIKTIKKIAFYELGIKEIVLIVQEQNEKAYNFWIKHGFKIEKT